MDWQKLGWGWKGEKEERRQLFKVPKSTDLDEEVIQSARGKCYFGPSKKYKRPNYGAPAVILARSKENLHRHGKKQGEPAQTCVYWHR